MLVSEIDPDSESVQDRAWPDGNCFGCGPANPDGLQLKSYLAEDEERLVATFDPEPTHDAGMGILCGGIAGTLIDCHSLWTAATLHRLSEGISLDENLEDLDVLWLTGEFSVRLKQPTPLDQPVHLSSRIKGDIGKKTTVHCELGTEDEITATGEAVIIQV